MAVALSDSVEIDETGDADEHCQDEVADNEPDDWDREEYFRLFPYGD